MYKCAKKFENRVQEQENMVKRPGGSSPGHTAINPLQKLGDYPGHRA
jgi:hypothetical protein